MSQSGSEPVILVPPQGADVPYARYPSLRLPIDDSAVMCLILLPVCLYGLWTAIASFKQTQDEIARSAYTTAKFVEEGRRPGVCRYTLEFPIAGGEVYRAQHVMSPGKRGCSWSVGEKVKIRYVRAQPSRLKLLEPKGDWTVEEAILFGLFIGAFTFIPCFVGTAIFAGRLWRCLLLRARGRPLIGELLLLEVTPHRSSIRFRGTGRDISSTWVSSYTLEVYYSVRTEEGQEIKGRHSLRRGEGPFTPPRPGDKLLIMYAGPRLHRAL